MLDDQWLILLLLAFPGVWAVVFLGDLVLMFLLKRHHPETWVRIGGPDIFRPGLHLESRRTYRAFLRSRDGQYPRLRLFLRCGSYVIGALFAAILIVAFVLAKQ